MSGKLTRDVRQLYEAHPYPSPVAGDGLIRDIGNMAALLFPRGIPDGATILDAGCGSGHRLVAFAKRFPRCRFLGVDMTSASLATARGLAEKHGVANLRFHQADLLELELAERFDLIVSTGVINCLEDPDRGLANLCRHLAPGGHILLWHYHAYGEFDRLLERELLLTFWNRHTMSTNEGIDIMRELGITLARERYSSVYAPRDNLVMDEVSMNVDAYLHPIVYAYTFDQALDMLARCDMDWAAVHAVNLGKESKLLDPGEASDSALRLFCVKAADLFPSPAIATRYRQLDNRSRLRAIELASKPNGFSLVAGKSDSYLGFDGRIRSGRVELRR